MMRAARAGAAVAVVALATGLATCDSGPQPGWLQLRVAGPAADNAGMLLTVIGGPIDSVRSALPTLLTAPPGASSVRMIVAGDAVSGVVAEIFVPDVGDAALYAGAVEQVAAVGTFAQRDPAGYRLTVERR
jgi:hypothetical protein